MKPKKNLSAIPSKQIKTGDSSDHVVRTILMVALVVLVGFSFLYIFNITQSIKKLEAFYDVNVFRVVYIYSDYCPYCTEFSPRFETVSKNSIYHNVTFESFEKSNPFAAKYLKYVTGFPSVLVIDPQNKLVDSLVGSSTVDDLKSFVERAISYVKK